MNTDADRSIKSSVQHCNSCCRIFKLEECWFSCTGCINYNLCELCRVTTQPPHPHPAVHKLTVDYGIEKIYTTEDMTRRIPSAIEFHWNRPCSSIRDVCSANSTHYAKSYPWETFKVVDKGSRNFSDGLQHLTQPQ